MYRIYFEDGTVFQGDMPRWEGKAIEDTYEEYIAQPKLSKKDTPPFKAVTAILQIDSQDFAELLTNKEYYLWRDGYWVGTDFWHVLYYLQDNFDFVEYRGHQKRVRNHKNNKWNSVDSASLFAEIEKTGLVLLGTVEPPERNLEIMKQVYLDMKELNFPEIMTVGEGTRIRNETRR